MFAHPVKEKFSHQETAHLLGLLDEVARAGRVSRGRAFEDFLTLSLCALSGGAMEDEYLAAIKTYTDEELGKRVAKATLEGFGIAA